MREKVEDIEVNLTGEESNHSDAADKSRWFKRIRKGINTSTADKKETPEGLWTKCPTCNHICTSSELKENCTSVTNVIITIALVVMNILTFYLTTKNALFFLMRSKVRMHLILLI